MSSITRGRTATRGMKNRHVVLIDDIHVSEFSEKTLKRRIQFYWKYFVIVKGFAVALSDFFLLISIAVSYSKSADLQEELSGIKSSPRIPVSSTVLFSLYLVAILVSWAMSLFEYRLARGIIKSRVVTRSFTNTMAYRMHSLQSFAHCCFFEKIRESRTWRDTVSMWVYFSLQAWRRIFIAQLLLTANRVIIFVNMAYSGPQQHGTAAIVSTFSRIMSETSSSPSTRVFQIAVLLLSFIIIIDWAISVAYFIVAAIAWISLRIRLGYSLRRHCENKIERR